MVKAFLAFNPVGKHHVTLRAPSVTCAVSAVHGAREGRVFPGFCENQGVLGWCGDMACWPGMNWLAAHCVLTERPRCRRNSSRGDRGTQCFILQANCAMCSQHGMSLSLSVLLTYSVSSARRVEGPAGLKKPMRTIQYCKKGGDRGGLLAKNSEGGIFSALTLWVAGSKPITGVVLIWLSYESKVSEAFMH